MDDKEIINKRHEFLKQHAEIARQTPFIGTIERVPENIKSLFGQRIEGFMEISPEPFVYEKFIRRIDPKDADINDMVIQGLVDAGYIDSSKESGLSNSPSDIFFSNTIPLKHLTLQPHITKYDENVDTYDLHVIDDETRNKNIAKVLSGELKEADVMWIRDTNVFKKKGFPNGWIRIYNRFVVERDKDYIAMKRHWYWEASESVDSLYEDLFHDPYDTNVVLSEALQCFLEVYNAWYTLQQCVLTKELFPFVKKSKTTMDFLKTGYVSKEKKKLINKYIIQFEKIQEQFTINTDESGKDPDKRKYRKPLWHVTGHWRHYKNGKVVFVQGYWKGPERNNDEMVIAPIEISLDNWYDLFDN